MTKLNLTSHKCFIIFRVLIFMALFFGITIRLLSINNNYHHPDEIIAVKVSQNILNTNKLDTNWGGG